MGLDILAAFANYTGRTAADFFGANPLARAKDDGTGKLTISHWDASLGPKPTIEQLLAAPLPTDKLLEHADKKLAAYWVGALNVDVGTEGAPLTLSVDVSSKGQTFVAGLMLDVSLGATSETWFQNGGSLSLSPEQVQALGRALKAYVEAAMGVWQQAERGIADQSITSLAQIDALPWPPGASA